MTTPPGALPWTADTTPTPWSIDEPWPGDYTSVVIKVARPDGNGRNVIAFLPSSTREGARAPGNAALIVRAVNAYGRLVAALDAALDQTEDGLHQPPCDVPDCWVEAARAALAATRADCLAEAGQ